MNTSIVFFLVGLVAGSYGRQRIEGNTAPADRPPYQAYLDQRKWLSDSERQSMKAFDQFMLALPAAALGLTITFTKDLAPHPKETWMLADCWLAFGTALLSTLVSLLTSQRSLAVQRDILDDEQRLGHAAVANRRNWSSLITVGLNGVSILAFMVGVYFVAQFAVMNMPTSTP